MILDDERREWIDRHGGPEMEDIDSILRDMPPPEKAGDWMKWYATVSDKTKASIEEMVKGAPKFGPQPGAQTRGYNSKADELGYGGAAGGGKSALMALKVTQLHHRSVLFRADRNQLSQLIDDVEYFWGINDGLNRQAGRYLFGDRPGHLLEWGGLGKPGSEKIWQGRAHDFIGFDEVTEIPYKRVRFVKGWLRSHIPGQQKQIMMTFNPPGSVDLDTGKIAGGRWVIPYYGPWIDINHPNQAQPGELRWYITNPKSGEFEEVPNGDPQEMDFGNGLEKVNPRSRTFIPARVQDNQYLMESGYDDHLKSLEPEMMRRMYLGEFLSEINDHPEQVIPTEWVKMAQARWRENPNGNKTIPLSALGVDVARGGLASTVIQPRHALWFDKPHKRPGTRTPSGSHVVGLVVPLLRDGAKVCIDANGVGTSPYDMMVGMGINVRGVQLAAKKMIGRKLDRRLDMYNKRAWLHWLMRKLLDPDNHMDVCIYPDPMIEEELTAPTYNTQKGSVIIEPKEEIIERIGRSPDVADAMILSLDGFFSEPEAEILIKRMISGKVGNNYQSGNPDSGGVSYIPIPRDRRDGWMDK